MASTKLTNSKLNTKQEAFCHYYVELNNGKQAALKAGYAPRSAESTASTLLSNPKVANKIKQLMEEVNSDTIASAKEVMEYFTKVMNGEILDQFGLEAPLAERTKAAQELAKRTVDIENRARGTADAKIEIKLDWGMDE